MMRYGIGCLVWWEDLVDIQELSFGGVDLYFRLSHTELGENDSVLAQTLLISILTFPLRTYI